MYIKPIAIAVYIYSRCQPPNENQLYIISISYHINIIVLRYQHNISNHSVAILSMTKEFKVLTKKFNI